MTNTPEMIRQRAYRKRRTEKLARYDAMERALQDAIGWFDEYAASHYKQALTAPSYGEQHGREVKGKTNRDRANHLRAALT